MIETKSTKSTRLCSEAWDALDGSAKVRYCYKCKRSVYNLTGLSDDEAKAFVERMEGVSINGLVQREDGKYMVADHVSAAAAFKGRVALAFTSCLAIIVLVGASVPKSFTFEPPSMAVQSAKPMQSEHFGAHDRDVYGAEYGFWQTARLERVRSGQKWIALRKELARERNRFIG